MKHAVADLLPFYVNGTLDDGERARVETEIASCAQCASELEELRAMAGMLQARAATIAPASTLHARTMARLGAPAMSSREPTAPSPWWSTPARYAAAASLVVGIGASVAAAWHAQHSVASSAIQNVSMMRIPAAPMSTPAPMQPKIKINTAKEPAAQMQGAPQGQASGPSSTTTQLQRRLAKSAQMELLVDDVERSLRDGKAIAAREGGVVTELTDALPRDEGVVHGATLGVEVPAARLDATLDALAALGTVRDKQIAAEDVDATIVDEEARLTNLRREERDLRLLMDRGGKLADVLSVQQTLSDVRGQIEQLQSEHDHNLHRVATSTIALSLTERSHAAAPPGALGRIADAWRDGARALLATIVDVLAMLAWGAGYAPLPLTLAAACYAGTLAVRRRWAR